MITGISGFGFFWSKNGRFVTYMWFSKKFAETPIFSPFRVRAFWAKLSRKANCGHPPKKRKIWVITDKLIFEYVLVFLFRFFFCCFFGFFGGLKGHVRWPEGPPHLALNHPYLFLFFFWGFKGQVRWPEGPPHLALFPPYLLFLLVFFVGSFPFFAFNRETLFSP